MLFLKNYPDFICIGAQKSGTSWLYKQLCLHPQIIMHKKELRFFPPHTNFPILQIQKHFYNYENYICGDMTPEYFISKKTAYILYNNFPKTKIFVILRNPVERAFSQYRMSLSKGNISKNCSFIEAFKNNFRDISFKGMYDIQLNNYLKFYKLHDSLKVFLYDDLLKNPKIFFEDVCKYLNIKIYIPHTIYTWEKQQYYYDGLKISERDKKFVKNYYNNSIKKLENILNIEINWMK